MKIYIACGLTHVPRALFGDHTEFIHGLAGALRTHSPEIKIKYALVNSDPQLATKPFGERVRLCYLWDREMVEDADLIVAECSFPSIGLGIEMQIAQHCGTPIVVCFRNHGDNRMAPITYQNPDSTLHELQIGEGFVSLMALGIPEIIQVVQYNDLNDGIKKIIAAVELFEKT